MIGSGIPPPAFLGVDHITLLVGNAKQAASYYCTRLGFRPIGYRGLETGHRSIVSHVVAQNNVKLVFQSPLEPNNLQLATQLGTHGDFVKDIAFTVKDARVAFEYALRN